MPILDGNRFDTFREARSFTWSNILFRALWLTAWRGLAAWTPPQFHPWRRMLLRLFGAKIGRGALIWPSARIWYPPNLAMGDYSVLGWRTECYCMAPVIIGTRAVISQYAQLIAGSHDIDDPNFQLIAKPIHIGDYAWIALGAFVAPGVTVGAGAVLGAHALAFKDLEPWTIYVASPAQALRKRARIENNVTPSDASPG
jgi:putative colanic acid biosynthesis acetyltransferase WcaF